MEHFLLTPAILALWGNGWCAASYPSLYFPERDGKSFGLDLGSLGLNSSFVPYASHSLSEPQFPRL